MTAEQFLRELALRAEVVHTVPAGATDLEGVESEPALVIRIDPYDAEEFLNLTGVRVE